MTFLNNWYNNNLASYEEDYIDIGSGFCSDRNMANGSNFNSSTAIYYAAYERMYSYSPILQCSDEDILSKENGRLPNPIGLITADELRLGGMPFEDVGVSYLQTSEDYWTMSPAVFDVNILLGMAYVYYASAGGDFFSNLTFYEKGVRPVINLRADVELTGSGTTSNPYVVQT